MTDQKHAPRRRREIRVLEHVRNERAADKVHAALRRAILEGGFAPGERLDLQALARTFGVSTTPVKNAIQMLAAVGLVEVRPRAGTFVADLSAADVAETFDIRRTLECLAVETAVIRATHATIEHLRGLIQRMKEPATVEQHVRDNAEFHRTLLQASGNRQLLKVYDELNAHIRIARIHGSDGHWRKRRTEEHEEHVEMLQALRDKSASKLTRVITRHIDRAKAALIESLRVHARAERE